MFRARLRLLALLLIFPGIILMLAASPRSGASEKPQPPENLAPRAHISASAEYSDAYQARFVADGIVPLPGSAADVGQAWCVNGVTDGKGASLTFEWDNPVTVAEVVYYGRTAWCFEEFTELWKDYEVYLDGAATPVISGRFKMGDGPQRVRLPAPHTARKLVMKFTSSYGGNPGASEVQIFATNPPDGAFPPFRTMEDIHKLDYAGADEVDCASLRAMIGRLASGHGGVYSQAKEHLARLDALERARKSGRDVDAQLGQLQKEVLLFDVDKVLVVKRREIIASHVYTYHYEGFSPGGGLYVVSTRSPQAKPRELVASPNGQILDCDLSYDGKSALFSWRQSANEGYHVWKINVDGTGLKQITRGEWHDYNACWLPDGGIAFLSTRSPQFAYCWAAPVGIMYRMNADGSNVRKLSANYLNDFTPYVLNDGRIIYSRWEYVDRPAIPIQSLWTINPDGTGLAGYFGNRVLSPGTFMEARPVPGSTKIICTMTGHNGPARGAIGIIDRSRGANAQAAITNITPDTPVPPVDQGNGNTDGRKQYSSPLPLDADRFLVSVRGPTLVRDMAGTCRSIAIPPPSDGMCYFCAQPIRPRPRPTVIPSEIPAAKQTGQYAQVFLQDVYRGLEHYAKHGEITRIRVVREMPKTVRIDPSKLTFGFQFPVVSCGATYAPKDVIGEVPVNPDGSAFFKVPSGKPLYFMALDAQGRAVQRMRTFTHFMPGESQSCIGCHEPRGKAPRMGARMAAFGQKPRMLEKPEWGSGGFDYSRIVQPVLDRSCVRCHGPVDPPKGVDLTGGKTDYFNVSYETLARGRIGAPENEYQNPYTSWIPTYNGMEQDILIFAPKSWGSMKSKLADIILSGHPDENGHPRIGMDEPSQRRILAWIDLNVPYYGTSETAYPDNKGCRKIYPDQLDKVLADVTSRRCTECHANGIPRKVWTRITEPEYNTFLLAPLAKSAGGSGKCGRPVFTSKSDPDYRAILAAFEPVQSMLKRRPRMDMPGAVPARDVCRDRK